MALRYWVGGSANWDGTAGTKWSLTSGGVGGQAVPTYADDVIFDTASGTVTITIAGTVPCRSLVAGTFTGTFQGSGNIQILGSNTGIQNSGKTLEWGPPGVGGMTYSYTGAFVISSSTLPGSGGSGSINFNGQVVTGNISLNAGATNAPVSVWSLINDITVTGASITLGAGTFTTNNYNITTTRFDIGNNSLNKVLNFGTSLITITQSLGAAWVNQGVPGSIVINGTYTIRFTGTVTSSITFIGGGATYYNVELLRGTGTGAFIIQGSNTFINFTDATGTAAHDINFQIGTTQTFQNFNVRGASTSARVRFTTGPATLVKIGDGAVICDFLNLGANVTTASPDNTWYAGYNSTGSGTGWVLRNPLGLLTFGVGG